MAWRYSIIFQSIEPFYLPNIYTASSKANLNPLLFDKLLLENKNKFFIKRLLFCRLKEYLYVNLIQPNTFDRNQYDFPSPIILFHDFLHFAALYFTCIEHVTIILNGFQQGGGMETIGNRPIA